MGVGGCWWVFAGFGRRWHGIDVSLKIIVAFSLKIGCTPPLLPPPPMLSKVIIITEIEKVKRTEAKKLKREEAKGSEKLLLLFLKTKRKGSEMVTRRRF